MKWACLCARCTGRAAPGRGVSTARSIRLLIAAPTMSAIRPLSFPLTAPQAPAADVASEQDAQWAATVASLLQSQLALVAVEQGDSGASVVADATGVQARSPHPPPAPLPAPKL